MSNSFSAAARERMLKLRFLSKYLTSKLRLRSDLRFAFSLWQLTLFGDVLEEGGLNDVECEIIRILKFSSCGRRSELDKALIELYLHEHVASLSESISPTEMDSLCDNVQLYPVIGRSILFLQGDFGNVFYIVGRGHVNLYYEASKDREMALAGQFGKMRAVPYRGTDEGLDILGNMIYSLKEGSGFGEYAILAERNKLRSCAAVAMTRSTILFVIDAATYRAVFERHHFVQKYVAAAIKLLEQLPMFRSFLPARRSQIAYSMKKVTYAPGELLGKVGERIQKVIMITAGEVIIFATEQVHPEKEHSSSLPPPREDRKHHGHIPKVAVAVLGTGQIVGEAELMQEMEHFDMNYKAVKHVDALEMSSEMYMEYFRMMVSHRRQKTLAYKEIQVYDMKRRQNAASRATQIMRKLHHEDDDIKSKDDLVTVLPAVDTDSKKPATMQKTRDQISGKRLEQINPSHATPPVPLIATNKLKLRGKHAAVLQQDDFGSVYEPGTVTVTRRENYHSNFKPQDCVDDLPPPLHHHQSPHVVTHKTHDERYREHLRQRKVHPPLYSDNNRQYGIVGEHVTEILTKKGPSEIRTKVERSPYNVATSLDLPATPAKPTNLGIPNVCFHGKAFAEPMLKPYTHDTSASNRSPPRSPPPRSPMRSAGGGSLSPSPPSSPLKQHRVRTAHMVHGPDNSSGSGGQGSSPLTRRMTRPA